jgi:hypothetical protein
VAAETLQAVKQIEADYRARMREIVARAALPHDLPPQLEALRANLGVTAGPRKPALDATFGPMGYSCKVRYLHLAAPYRGQPDRRAYAGRRHLEPLGDRDLPGRP